MNKLTGRSSNGHSVGYSRKSSSGTSVARYSGSQRSSRVAFGPRNFNELSRGERIAHYKAIRDRRLGYIKDVYKTGQDAYKTYKSYVKPAIALLNRP
jgi:hypothetical protein